MFCSTIIPTIARSSVSRAVQSVLDQSFAADSFEIIVVNDSGQPLPMAAWQQSERVQVINTNRRERIFARNSGAAIAQGKYLHFLDDDDWLLPGALQAFWDLVQSSAEARAAHWLYGSSQLVDRQGKPIIQLHHGIRGNCFVQTMAGEWIPLQSSLINAEAFFALGGFTPLVHATQDVDLCRRISLHGEIAGTSQLVACIGMGLEASSTDYDRGPEYSRQAREKILDEPGVLARLRASADSSYWQGRIVRIYLTSFVWNLLHGRPFTAASRALYTCFGFAGAAPHILSPEFWRALKGRYISPTFLHGFDAAQQQLEPAAMQKID